MKKSLWEDLLLALFIEAVEHMPNWKISLLPFKYAGPEVPDPTLMAKGDCTISCVVH